MRAPHFAPLLVAAFSSCHPKASAPASERAIVVSVSPDLAGRADRVLLHWQGEYRDAGRQLAIIDATGYRGLIESAEVSSADCDHCAGPLVEAKLVAGAGPGPAAVAVGPVAAAVPRARLLPVAPPAELNERWQPSVQVDLDGDGVWDVQQVARCDHWVGTGCRGRACDRQCVAATRRGHLPTDEACHSFVPDVEDCVRPSAPASGEPDATPTE